MLYIAWMVILGGHNIKKQVSKTSIFDLPRLKNNLLMQFFTPGSSKVEVFETFFLMLLQPKTTIQGM